MKITEAANGDAQVTVEEEFAGGDFRDDSDQDEADR